MGLYATTTLLGSVAPLVVVGIGGLFDVDGGSAVGPVLGPLIDKF